MNKSPKILIIEDDEHVAKVYETRFSKEGFEVSFARDGEEGMEKARAQNPDLIILDLMLPKKDGFMVLEELKKDAKLSEVPVLVLSNLGGEADLEKTKELGAREHLVKVSHSMQDIIETAKRYPK